MGSYYPEYHTTTAYNGFIDVSLPTYDNHQLGNKSEEKIYCQQLSESPKYSYVDTRHPGSVGSSPYAASPATAGPIHATTDMNVIRASSRQSLEGASSSNSAGSSPVSAANGVLTPKMEDVKPDLYGSEAPRQTVLMWGAPPNRTSPKNNGSYSPPTPCPTRSSHSVNAPRSVNSNSGDPLKSLAEMNSINGDCKWKRTSPSSQTTAPSPPRLKAHQQQQTQQPPLPQLQYPVVTTAHYGATAAGYTHAHPGHSHGDTGSEVWQGVQHHHHYQYYPYHHHHPAPPRHTSQ